jgi:hypothetical protein
MESRTDHAGKPPNELTSSRFVSKTVLFNKYSNKPQESPEALKDRPTRSTKNKTPAPIKENRAHPQKLGERKHNCNVVPYEI